MCIFKFFAVENMFVNCVTLFDNKLEHLVLEYLDHKALVVELGMNKFLKCLTKEEYCIMGNLGYIISKLIND